MAIYGGGAGVVSAPLTRRGRLVGTLTARMLGWSSIAHLHAMYITTASSQSGCHARRADRVAVHRRSATSRRRPVARDELWSGDERSRYRRSASSAGPDREKRRLLVLQADRARRGARERGRSLFSISKP